MVGKKKRLKKSDETLCHGFRDLLYFASTLHNGEKNLKIIRSGLRDPEHGYTYTD